FAPDKTTRRARGRVLGGGLLDAAVGTPVEGYEIHCGQTRVQGGVPVFALEAPNGEETLDGARAGNVIGTYLHGCFSSGALRRAIAPGPGWGADVFAGRYDRLADHVASALDLDAVGRLAHCPLGAVPV